MRGAKVTASDAAPGEDSTTTAHSPQTRDAARSAAAAAFALTQNLTGDEGWEGGAGSNGSRQDRMERGQVHERERAKVTAAAAVVVVALMLNTNLAAAATASRFHPNTNSPNVRPSYR